MLVFHSRLLNDRSSKQRSVGSIPTLSAENIRKKNLQHKLFCANIDHQQKAIGEDGESRQKARSIHSAAIGEIRGSIPRVASFF